MVGRVKEKRKRKSKRRKKKTKEEKIEKEEEEEDRRQQRLLLDGGRRRAKAATPRRMRIPLGQRAARERERATHVEGAKAIFSGRQISLGPPTSAPWFVVGATLFQGATKTAVLPLCATVREPLAR